MDNDGFITVIVRRAGVRREIQIRVADAPGIRSDIPMFAGEVTRLAGLGGGGIARGCFAAGGGVEVGEGAGAVAVGGDGFGVDVVDYEHGEISKGF